MVALPKFMAKLGVLALADSSISPLRPTMFPKTVRVREPSCRRLGLIGGRGGAAYGSALLFDLERLLLRDLLVAASGGNSTVGTRDVVMTNVGSEMSRLLTARFMASLRPGTSEPSELTCGAGDTGGRCGEARAAGVGGPDPKNGDGMGDMGDGWPAS